MTNCAKSRGEREKLAARTKLAEERFEAVEERALVEIDHGGTAMSKLQKSLEAERSAAATTIDKRRTDYNRAHENLARLREEVGALQVAIPTLSDERDRTLR